MNAPELAPVLHQLYPTEGAHGRDHAQKTADLTWEISHEPEYDLLTDDDRLIVYAAALGHDSGYPAAKPYWSGTQR